MRHINETDALRLYSMEEALDVIESSTLEYGNGGASMPPKVYLSLPGLTGDFRAMPAFSAQFNVAGIKWVNSHPDNRALNLPTVRALILLNDPRTAVPLALVDGTSITGIRTGAAGGVAAKHMARPDSSRVAFVGGGVQSVYQALAICKVRAITEIRIYDLSRESQIQFTKQVREFFSGRLVECNSIQACVKDADIIVTTTPSRKPVVMAAWVAPGTHINAIGADAEGKQELDSLLLVNGRIVVDDIVQASHSGEVNVPLHRGVLSKRKVTISLADVVSKRKKGRQSQHQITIFDSTGLGIHDIASAGFLFHKAQQLGVGTDIVI